MIEDYLNTSDLDDGLASRTTKSGLVTLVGQVVKVAVRFGSITIMARLLTADDYGVYAMVTIALGIVMIFNELGLSHAVVQKRGLTANQASGLYWVNVGVGVVCALVFIGSAPLLAWWFDEPRVVVLQLVLSLVLLVSAMSAMHTALLVRRMRFVHIIALDTVGIVLGLLVGIAMGLSGAGYWSLAMTEITFWLVRSFGSWAIVRWFPRPPRDWSGVRSLVSFGADVTAFKVLRFISGRIDQTLLGWLSTSTELGRYNRGVSVITVPLANIGTPLSHVAIPALSKLQDSDTEFMRFYGEGLRALAWLVIPLSLWLSSSAEVIVPFLLGPGWEQVVPLAAIFGIAGIAFPVHESVNWLFVPQGKTRTLVVWGVVGFAVSVPIFAAGYIYGGVTGVAWAYVVSLSFRAILGAALHSFSTLITSLKTIVAPTVCAIITALLASYVLPLTAHFPLVVRVVLLSVLLGACVLVATVIVGDLRRIVSLVYPRLRRNTEPANK